MAMVTRARRARVGDGVARSALPQSSPVLAHAGAGESAFCGSGGRRRSVVVRATAPGSKQPPSHPTIAPSGPRPQTLFNLDGGGGEGCGRSRRWSGSRRAAVAGGAGGMFGAPPAAPSRCIGGQGQPEGVGVAPSILRCLAVLLPSTTVPSGSLGGMGWTSFGPLAVGEERGKTTCCYQATTTFTGGNGGRPLLQGDVPRVAVLVSGSAWPE